MKILAISHLFPNIRSPRYGIFAARQLAEMARLGSSITVFVPQVFCPRFLRRFERWKNFGHNIPLCKFNGLDTIPVPMPRPPGGWFNRWSGLVVYLLIRGKAKKLHCSNNFDVIYATDLFPDGNAAVRLGNHLDVPSTCLAIGVDVNVTARSSPSMNRHFEQTVRGLDGALACGSSVARGIDAVRGDNAMNVYGVIDLDEFSPTTDQTLCRGELGINDDEIVILFAGYLAKRKGIYELIEAYSRVADRADKIRLVLCGAGAEAESLTELVRERGLDKSVHFAGEVAPERMRIWMRASDLFVLPSHTEGMPNVVMEAMACGIPVISTTVGGLPDAVGDCDGVILVAPQDVDALAGAISKVVSDDRLRQQMGAAGRMRAEERFGVTGNAQRIIAYLNDVIVKRRA